MAIFGVGHNNFLPKDNLLIILQVNSRPVRNLITNAKKTEKLIDATNGHKTKSVLMTVDGFVVLSAITPKTLAERFQREEETF